MPRSSAALLVTALVIGPAAAAPPDDANRVLTDLQKELAVIDAKAQAEAKARKDKAVESLKVLQEKYTKAGALDDALAVRDLIRSLTGPGIKVRSDPANLRAMRGEASPLYFEVLGSIAGSVWGTDEYTDDSSLATAAVHAGALKAGQKGIVKVTLLPGKNAYTGSTRNSVSSSSYEAFGGGYKVESALEVAGAERGIDPLPTALSDLRGRNGTVYFFEITGRSDRNVWGTGTYTDDSDLATAAVHAGVLKDGQKGVIKVTILAGQDGYEGSEKNGVTSRKYESFPGSFKVEPK